MIREDDMSVCGEGSKEGWEGGLVLKGEDYSLYVYSLYSLGSVKW